MLIPRSDAEIDVLVKKLWPKVTTRGVVQSDGYVYIKLENVGAPPGLSFQQLMALSEFFGTKSINDDDRYRSSGCDTCDYDTVSGFTLVIRPEADNVPSL